MRTSGLTLDFYDDAGCEQLKEMFPRGDALPQSTKTASVLTQADQDMLPDDVFALVVQGEGQTLRKFACFDSGNTELSIHYFLKNAHKLPEAAQAQVAQNLKVACSWYGIETPAELEEIANGRMAKVGGIVGGIAKRVAANPLGTAMTAATLPSQVQGVHGEIKRNVAATRAAQEATGISAVTPEQVEHFKTGSAGEADALAAEQKRLAAGFGGAGAVAGGLAGGIGGLYAGDALGKKLISSSHPVLGNLAEIAVPAAGILLGTSTGMGVGGLIGSGMATTREGLRDAVGLNEKGAEVVGTSDMPLQPPGDKEPKAIAVVKKTGAAQRMNVYEAGRDEKGKPDTNEATKGKAPAVAPKMNPHIDVTGKTASLEIPQAFTNYALGDKYPLDSYMHVKTANSYFKEYGMMFSPAERHQYCSAVVQRADALGVDIDPMVRKYGSAGYAPDDEIEMALQMRRNVLQNQTALDLLDKMASSRKDLPPHAFVEALEEFDKVACINHHWDSAIYDPYFSTYGTSEKTASEKEESFVDNIGNARITGPQLKAVSLTKHLQLRDVFGEDFCDEFKKDPVSIYNSMPREQKLMLINLANDNAPGVRGSIE